MSPNTFRETKLRETKPRSKCVRVQKTKGNECHMYMLMEWGWVKRTPLNFGEIRLRERKPRSNFVWVQKANGNKYIYMLMPWSWVKRSLINLEETRPRERKPRSKFVGSKRLRPSENVHIVCTRSLYTNVRGRIANIAHMPTKIAFWTFLGWFPPFLAQSSCIFCVPFLKKSDVMSPTTLKTTRRNYASKLRVQSQIVGAWNIQR